jgi:hypothetical protein
VPRQKIPRPKAARAQLDAAELVVRACKLAPAGKLEAAYEAMRRAQEAVKKAMGSHSLNEQERRELDAILRGGASFDGELSLGEILCGPSPDEARDRVQQYLGGLKTLVGAMASRSETGRGSAAENEKAQFNRRVEEALAEVHLPREKGARGAAAVKHLRGNHLELWQTRAPGHAWTVGRRTKNSWFRERMTASQQLRAERQVSGVNRPATKRR